MGDAPKLPAVLKQRPRPVPRWAAGTVVVSIVVVLLFALAGISCLLVIATTSNTGIQVTAGIAAVVLFVLAALFPGNMNAIARSSRTSERTSRTSSR